MSVQVADDVDTLFDGEINVNEALTWEFLGGDGSCPSWSRWSTYRAGECVCLPSGEVWCARRSVTPGEVGPGEMGWRHAWEQRGTTMGVDSAADDARAQRHHGRDRVSVGADDAAEDAYAQRFHGRNGQKVGALVADYQAIKEAYRDAAAIGSDPVSQAAHVTKKIITRARDTAIPAVPPARVTHYDATDEVSIDPVQLEILGTEEMDTANFPVATSLYKRFRARTNPKFVRLDTDDTYRNFRADQSPEIADLRDRVARLEMLVRSHTADGHGAQDVIVGLASDVSALQDAVAGKRVPLQMPPWAEGTWDCWHEEGTDGGLVCCSIALPGHDGHVRICTAAAPVRKRVNDVVGYAHEVGADVVTLLGVLPTVACMLTGRDLMTEMAAAAPQVLAHPGAKDTPFIGKIVPANHPTMATLIMLLQTAQAGNAQATKEWEALSRAAQSSRDLFDSMTEARRRLLANQTDLLGTRRDTNRSRSLLGAAVDVVFGWIR